MRRQCLGLFGRHLLDLAGENCIELLQYLRADNERFVVKMARVNAARYVPLVRKSLVVEIDQNVRVDKDGATVVVLDTLNGYLLSMPDEHFPLLHIHELLTYLNQQGVVTLIITAQNGVVGPLESQIDASYLADTMLALRYFESSGRVRQAISVIKNRHGAHERTIRELVLNAGTGIVVGEPITAFDGVLSGQPRYRGQLESQLMPGINPVEAPPK